METQALEKAMASAVVSVLDSIVDKALRDSEASVSVLVLAKLAVEFQDIANGKA